MGAEISAVPTLHGLIGRPVASVSGYNYSAGLRAAGGVWTKERLNRFLAHPSGFAGGTFMKPWAVTDPQERRVIVDYLAELK
jgi:cytochrome c